MAYSIATRQMTLPLGSGVFHFVMDAKSAFTKWRTYNRTLNELNSLSKRELDDLGLEFSNLSDIARNATYGR